ncbi:TrmH family RNA methyltransferase [Maridesulfovibrio bastinii]|uniref:TrmH family RNA methyltransferase n=1 Tax=Maridesulfovibrio bastinii TaxID=47157 RepID=UPI000417D0FE|nr:RNA methyltransferase [Maridesulfovibrio bastinii]
MKRERTTRREERIRHVLARRQNDLSLIIDNVWDPHNVAAILRSCDAFGVSDIHLYYTENVWPELTSRSAASAQKWVDRTVHEDPAEMISSLKSKGYQIVRTGFSEKALPLMDYDFSKPSAIVLSNEHNGTSPELLPLVENELYIPMQGMIQSFNVSVAAAIILYHAFTQRYSAGKYDRPSWPPDEMEAKVEDWLCR